MLFRKSAAAHGLDAEDKAEWTIDLGGEHGVIVQFQEDSYIAEEPSEGYEEEIWYLRVTAQGEWDLDTHASELMRSVDGRGTFYVRSLSVEQQQVIRSIDQFLLDSAKRMMSLVQWRFGVRGHHESLRGGSLEWKDDGGQWQPMSFGRSLIFRREPTARFPPEVVNELMPLVFDEGRGPLGHSLLREAWDLKERNPRGALVIGVAAAEVGFKQFAIAFAPQAAWLIEELQSPPLEKLLRKYLPILLEDQDQFAVKAIPRSIINAIDGAVQQRNTVAHKSPTAKEGHQKLQQWFAADGLESALLAVSDLLWFFDFYRGYTWALDHIRRESREQLESLAS
jgi:hypothetical protein